VGSRLKVAVVAAVAVTAVLPQKVRDQRRDILCALTQRQVNRNLVQPVIESKRNRFSRSACSTYDL